MAVYECRVMVVLHRLYARIHESTGWQLDYIHVVTSLADTWPSMMSGYTRILWRNVGCGICDGFSPSCSVV